MLQNNLLQHGECKDQYRRVVHMGKAISADAFYGFGKMRLNGFSGKIKLGCHFFFFHSSLLDQAVYFILLRR